MRIVAHLFVFAALGLPGCTDPLALPDAACAGHLTRAACLADEACAVDPGCVSCAGAPAAFLACHPKGDVVEHACPAVSCAPSCAAQQTAATCDAQNGCFSVYGGKGAFAYCASGAPQCVPANQTACFIKNPVQCDAGLAPIYDGSCAVACVKDAVCAKGELDCRTQGCPAGESCGACYGPPATSVWFCMPEGLSCASPTDPCIGHDEASCTANADCHAVYDDPGTCDCSTPGCCVRYTRCATGRAMCVGIATCDRTPPDCGPNYVASYRNGCYEGCVKPEMCTAGG